TGTPTNTPTPTPTPIGGVCFNVTVGGWTFAAAACPSNGHAVNVQVAPPSGLQLETSLAALPALSLDSQGHPVVPIALAAMTIAEFGFSLAAPGNSLSANGLSVSSAALSLPADLGSGTLTASNLAFGVDGSISGTVSFSQQSATFSAGGFSLDATGLHL